MALNNTTLASAMAAGDTVAVVGASTGFAAGNKIVREAVEDLLSAA